MEIKLTFEFIEEKDLLPKKKKSRNKTPCEDGCCEPRSISAELYDYAKAYKERVNND